ncbi:hypothetical protein [Mycoplasmopsis pulmonis]|uniref:hypothetical protein n=1 Tax=Mycoplasmopsis pulmonis TaxID=2107 RepID=UPI002ACDFA3E|nr:hypothetical protein [Mycoplasmopsis pulmonis]MDZ7293328.1 hypothetical protein [Mycoplasmopsis pulmonis]
MKLNKKIIWSSALSITSIISLATFISCSGQKETIVVETQISSDNKNLIDQKIKSSLKNNYLSLGSFDKYLQVDLARNYDKEFIKFYRDTLNKLEETRGEIASKILSLNLSNSSYYQELNNLKSEFKNLISLSESEYKKAIKKVNSSISDSDIETKDLKNFSELKSFLKTHFIEYKNVDFNKLNAFELSEFLEDEIFTMFLTRISIKENLNAETSLKILGQLLHLSLKKQLQVIAIAIASEDIKLEQSILSYKKQNPKLFIQKEKTKIEPSLKAKVEQSKTELEKLEKSFEQLISKYEKAKNTNVIAEENFTNARRQFYSILNDFNGYKTYEINIFGQNIKNGLVKNLTSLQEKIGQISYLPILTINQINVFYKITQDAKNVANSLAVNSKFILYNLNAFLASVELIKKSLNNSKDNQEINAFKNDLEKILNDLKSQDLTSLSDSIFSLSIEVQKNFALAQSFLLQYAFDTIADLNEEKYKLI